MTNNAYSTQSDLEFGTLETTFAVDIDTSDGRTIARITEQTTDSVGAGETETVITEYELDAPEAQSLIKTLQDGLEQNGERNVVGYPAALTSAGTATYVHCPQCREPLSAADQMVCDSCGAQLELSVRVTAQGDH